MGFRFDNALSGKKYIFLILGMAFMACPILACHGSGSSITGTLSQTGTSTNTNSGFNPPSGVPTGSPVGTSGNPGPTPPPGTANGVSVVWGNGCLYNFGPNCPFKNAQECGNHQMISVTITGSGSQQINGTLFAGLNCSPNALADNLDDNGGMNGSGLWGFTDDADVPGVTANTPSSAIFWVGDAPYVRDGYPPAGEVNSGCINYTINTPPCQ